MKREELIGTVKDIIGHEVEVPVDNLELDTQLADLDIDSLDVLKLGLAFEKSFNIQLSTSELVRIRTFGDIVTGLEDRLPANEPI